MPRKSRGYPGLTLKEEEAIRRLERVATNPFSKPARGSGKKQKRANQRASALKAREDFLRTILGRVFKHGPPKLRRGYYLLLKEEGTGKILPPRVYFDEGEARCGACHCFEGGGGHVIQTGPTPCTVLVDGDEMWVITTAKAVRGE